MILNTNLQYKF